MQGPDCIKAAGANGHDLTFELTRPATIIALPHTLLHTSPTLHAPTMSSSSSSGSNLASPSLVSVTTTSSASSSTPLRKPSSPPKDFSAAFGLLSSQYGVGLAKSPLPPAATPQKERKEKKEKRSTSEKEEARTSSGTKDFEAAHAALSSRFGFGGSWPIPKRQTKTKDAGR